MGRKRARNYVQKATINGRAGTSGGAFPWAILAGDDGANFGQSENFSCAGRSVRMPCGGGGEWQCLAIEHFCKCLACLLDDLTGCLIARLYQAKICQKPVPCIIGILLRALACACREYASGFHVPVNLPFREFAKGGNLGDYLLPGCHEVMATATALCFRECGRETKEFGRPASGGVLWFFPVCQACGYKAAHQT